VAKCSMTRLHAEHMAAQHGMQTNRRHNTVRCCIGHAEHSVGCHAPPCLPPCCSSASTNTNANGPQAALFDFDTALDIDPESIQALMGRASIHMHFKNHQVRLTVSDFSDFPSSSANPSVAWFALWSK